MANDNVQSIRTSQFVLTYGPGAIIEARTGPVLILSLDIGLDGLDIEQCEKNEISDNRICTILGNLTGRSARVFTVPTNESLGIPSNRGIYKTAPFPEWRICYEKDHHGHERMPVLFRGKECPVCHRGRTSSAVRFVVACPSGHMDDAPWHSIVHGYKSCNTEYYWWNSRGSSLQDVRITCPDCGESTNMREAYSKKYQCKGRFPEHRVNRQKHGCNEKMSIMQRQSTSLRQPDIFTLLKIPELDDPLSILHDRSEIRGMCRGILFSKRADPGLTMEGIVPDIEEALRSSGMSGSMLKRLMDRVSGLTVVEFKNKLEGGGKAEKTNLDYIYDEFDYLTSGTPRGEKFSMGVPVPIGAMRPLPQLDIYPIGEIRTVTVQAGYRRMVPVDDPDKRKRVEVCARKGDDSWFPGYEGVGEGLFITVHGDMDFLEGHHAYGDWIEKNTRPDVLGPIGLDSIWRDLYQQPLWVWYHTLSHALIGAISLTSGYSAASIRERVYLSRDGRRGGILLYTTASGEDSSMGGLMESSGRFEGEIIPRAVESLQFCSNDPLCHDERKTEGRVHGAACFSCLMISETSCEHRNYWLDRHLVLGD